MPRSRLIINFVLVIVVGGLIALAYFRPGLERPADVKLTQLDPSAVQTIVIENGRGTIRLVRSDTGWRLPELGLPADDFQADILLDLLSIRSERRYALKDIDREAVGLDPAQARVLYDDEVIELGKTEPLQDLRYLRYGDQVHLIQDRLLNLLQTDATDLASRRLIPREARLTRIELPEATLARTETHGWTIDPEDPRVSADRLQQVVDAWRNTQAVWLRPAADREPHSEVVLHFETGEAIRYGIIREPSDLILVRQDPGVEYHLSPFKTETLLELEPREREERGDIPPEEIEPAAGMP